MPEKHPIPVVPLEAGGGPENPPCPACGEPLFGWIDALPGLEGAVRRCESCGLGVAGEPGGAEEALEDLDRRGSGQELAFANRAGFAAWIGGAGWAGLEPGATHLFTPDAARRLLARRDRVVRSVHWAPSAAIATTWQTILNGFTFGRDVGLGLLGRSAAVGAGQAWQRRLDVLITLVVALPALLVAVPLEAAAAALRRPAAVRLKVQSL